MTEYEDQLLEFYKDKENFTTMMTVAQHADWIPDHFVKAFWYELEQRVKERFAPADSEWTVGFSGAWNSAYNKLSLVKSSWVDPNTSYPIIDISFEDIALKGHPFLGITCNHTLLDKYDIPDIKKEILKAINNTVQYKTDNHHMYWILWSYFPYKQDNPDHLINHLVHGKEDTFTKYMNEI
ncbi:MAG: hypothetical protein WBA74_21140, partial [Cyclobacteriaceae bacterium]